jgi:hypothetical protein
VATDEDLVCTECGHTQTDGEYCESCGLSLTVADPEDFQAQCAACGAPRGNGQFCRQCGAAYPSLGSPSPSAATPPPGPSRSQTGGSYRVGRWISRHKTVFIGSLVGSIVVIVLALIGLAIVSAAGDRRADAEAYAIFKPQMQSWLSQHGDLCQDEAVRQLNDLGDLDWRAIWVRQTSPSVGYPDPTAIAKTFGARIDLAITKLRGLVPSRDTREAYNGLLLSLERLQGEVAVMADENNYRDVGDLFTPAKSDWSADEIPGRAEDAGGYQSYLAAYFQSH